jgi:Leucine-rich repeat (LRR) protein
MLDLDLGMNKLEILPEAFGNMSRLVNLNLSDNRLTDLPLSIGNCKVLNSVFIDR